MPANKTYDHISGPQLDHDLELEADVVIVGSGAGGATSAEVLSAAGLKVVIVEAGPYGHTEDFLIDESWSYPHLFQDVASRKTEDKAISIFQGRNVGGGTTVNWTACFRAPDQTLSFWQDRFSVRGVDSKSLLSHYEQVEKKLNIHAWTHHSPNNQLLYKGLTKLGWHHDVIARNVKQCSEIGACGLGCPVGAKQSMLVTSIPAALEKGATLLSGVRVERLERSGDSIAMLHAVAMQDNYADPSPYRIRIRAKRYIVAGGSINSPALLKRSKLPDPHGNLGKRMFLHPTLVSIANTSSLVEANTGAPQSIYSDEFLWKAGVTGEIGYKIEVPPVYPVLAATVLYPWGKPFGEIMNKLPNAHVQIAILRDGFNDDESGAALNLSRDGYPLINYRYTDRLWRAVRRAYLSMTEAQFAAGSEFVFPVHTASKPYKSWREAKRAIESMNMAPMHAQLFSAHQMGGCNMGEDEQFSVVNSKGRHHQIGNLYVCDGSLFPTGLGVNPQLTIYALANKFASELADSIS